MRARINPEKTNYVYLAQMFFPDDGRRLIKVGVSNSLVKRMMHLKFVHGVEAVLLDVFTFPTRRRALEVEAVVKKSFQQAFPERQTTEILDGCPLAMRAIIEKAAQ